MISRVAENCYWLSRYVERAESLARLLQASLGVLLDVDLPEFQRWGPLLIVAGEQPAFREAYAAEREGEVDLVLDFLTWDERCGVSIRRCIQHARENARTSRETVSRELWEIINEAYLWLGSDDARQRYESDRPGFFTAIKQVGHAFRGASMVTMLREEPFHFVELGMHLERADQTARILDVRHHLLDSATSASVDGLVWTHALFACAAYEPYFKRSQGEIRGEEVADFLYGDPSFPRSVRGCLDGALDILERLDKRRLDGAQSEALRRLRALERSVESRTMLGRNVEEVHEELTRTVEGLAGVGAALYDDYFNPAPS